MLVQDAQLQKRTRFLRHARRDQPNALKARLPQIIRPDPDDDDDDDDDDVPTTTTRPTTTITRPTTSDRETSSKRM